MDPISILGYANNSPYRNNPYLDIQTPEGYITMENTPHDLLGIDNLGNIKKMKAGTKKQYKFPGTTVREIPLINPYQQGGLTSKQMFDFLFEEDEEGPNPPPKAPTVEDVDTQTGLEDERRRISDQENEALAMQYGMGNPYQSQAQQPSMGNPYMGEIKSSGKFGAEHIGQRGKEIYGSLANDLGYAPTVNSIFRSREQQDALIASGAPAVKNSFHLTGDAIDLKPEDWHKLSNEKQLYYRQNYDVVYHNKHYHIEPRN